MSATKGLLACTVAVLALGPFAATSEAQPHGHFRVSVAVPVVVGGGYYYDPYFYDPWYGSQVVVYPPPYYGSYLPADASLKLEVKPNDAEVYVDGYYAGIVDDFDGPFQRLRVAPGEHEIELYLDGYRTVKQKIYVGANATFKVTYAMERLAAGEQPQPRPEPVTPPEPPGGRPPYGPPPYPPSEQPQRPPVERRMPPRPPQAPGARGAQASGYGTLSIRVQPADAEVSIDGEPWRSPGGQERLVVDLAEGSHTVEIRKQGYRTYVTQIDVRRGDTTPLNVSLRGEP